MDRSLLGHDVLWAAAGRPDAVFSLTPGDLEHASGAVVADLAVVPRAG
jgi:prolyl-tRNA editing enzyme YbaK/EbsC (Cys-tRNA(Pro) deacylase)